MSDPPPDDGTPSNVTRLTPPRRPASRLRNVTTEGKATAGRLAGAQQIIGEAPYEPIGFNGERYFVLDSERYVRSALPRDLGSRWLESICGVSNYLRDRYPRTREGRDGVRRPVNGYEVDRAARDLMNACHHMGFWEPTRIRGAGAWSGEDGDLILHRGDHLIIRGQVRPLGRVGDYVYEPGPPLVPLPKLADTGRCGHELMDRLETFPFRRGTFDATLLLGQLGASILGGALKFRVHLFLTGEFDSGKTTLQLLIRHVLGMFGIVDITDATAAAIWQALKGRSVPIGYDEFEPEPDPQKQDRILKLARQASMGAMVRRGSPQHGAAEFPLISCFICSAILAPPLNSADASRWLLMELQKSNVPRPAFSVDRLEQLGAALTVRLADRWQQLQGVVMPEMRRLMSDRGYSGRIIDFYGTLISIANVVLFDTPEEMRLAQTLDGWQMRQLLAGAMEEQTAEYVRCVSFLQSSRTERNRVSSDQFGELIREAAAPFLLRDQPRLQRTIFGDDEQIPSDTDGAARAAQRKLMQFGLKVARIGDDNAGGTVVLQVAHHNQQLAEVFEHTRWRSSAESATGGGWTQALRRAPGASLTATPVRFRGATSRAVNVPIMLFLQPGVSPTPATPTARPEDEDGDAAGAAMLH